MQSAISTRFELRQGLGTAVLACLLVTGLYACGDNLTFPSDPAAYEGPVPPPLPCLPNLDGRIEAHEMAPTLNQIATYRVSPPLPADSPEGRPVDVVGTIDEQGRRVWDWSQPHPDDRVAELIATPLGSQWYVAHFPAGEFALAVDAGGRLDGIYSHTDEALWLHGFASHEPDPPEGRTLLVYQDPVRFFPFPLSFGQTWTETGIVRNGVLNGLSPWSQDDIYEVSVDALGELRLPDFTFTQALRVYTRVTVQPKVGSREGYTQHQHSFVFECFGEVARASSAIVTDPADDPGPNFAIAHEVRRLGWF